MRADLPADLAELVSRPPVYRLLGVGEKVHGKHLNHVWKGLAGVPWLDEPAIPLFAKFLPKPGEIDIELGCGLASQVLKLPVPPPAIVLAGLDDLPQHPANLTADQVILFGSLFQSPDPFLARRTANDLQAAEFIWDQVCQNEVGPVGAAWDELVANPDRHVQNLIFDGGKWWLFDHNMALQPLSKLYAALDDDGTQRKLIDHIARVNQIIEQLKQRRAPVQEVRAQAEKLNRQSKRLKILAIEMRKWHVDHPQVAQILKMASVIVDLIALRLAPLSMYIDQRFDGPVESTLWIEP